MATIQQSIEIKVPVQIAYNQLTQFQDYPGFMDGVEAVQQIDGTHLHWTTAMSNRPFEWDAKITDQEADRRIGWRDPKRMQVNALTQSDYSLSKSSDDDSSDDGRFSVAEEVNFDQQSDAARQVGQMPQDTGTEQQGATSASDAMGKAMQKDSQDAKRNAKLKPSIDRSVPPSE